ncbi:MAG TPA: two-component regulator propeller domain-containing protein, partial [Pyrinomonadaceae bacterium]|nr:two-component regulator propeller domain-containing protein [Pyrinomonadaceae bacterium]
ALIVCCISLSASFSLPSILSAQTAKPSPSPTPATTPAQQTPTPTPTPTPPSTLHQWGAVTLFHGLPSDRVRAIAQGQEGAMWFGTDAGLAKYDGRRTQAVAIEGLTSKRILALRLDADGALWIGTEAGAGLLPASGEYMAIPETAGKVITAIITPESGRAILASEEGVIYDCRREVAADSLAVKTIPEKPLASADFERPGPLNLTSLAMKDGALYIGTRSRGVIKIEAGTVSEIRSSPRPFFVETIETDAKGRLWYGAKAKAEESGLYEAHDAMRPVRIGAGLGMVTALRTGASDDMWVGTDGRGVFHYDTSSRLRERFTFEGTAGGLRSDHVYAVFVDREEVVWFGTDRGVSRYDPHAPRVENVSAERESNFVRTLFQAANGPLLAGTNRGLFIYDGTRSDWSPVQDLSQSPVYAITEDKRGRIVVGAGNGLYRSEKPARESAGELRLTRIEAVGGGGAETGGGVRALAQFQGEIYVGTYGRGVERLDAAGRTLIWPGAQGNAQEREVVHLHADKSGRLWIGTALSGVFVFDGRETKSLPALEKLRGSAVWSINDGGDDHLWLASARGLYLYHAGRLDEVAQGFDARSVIAAATDASSTQAGAWCATSGGGLLRVLMNDQLGAVVSRIDAEQGLPSQSAFALLSTRGDRGAETLLIGTNRGVARYSPGSVAPVLSPVRISGQRIHELSELKGGLHLDYPQNSLLLDVAATSSRTYPEQFQYAFLLSDGAGRVIKKKFSHDAQFTMESLKPGNYHVTVRAFSKDLAASEPLAFEFAVAGAPFPRTIVALSVLLTLALLALWWGYHQNRRLARTGVTLADTNRQLADARVQLANETEAERRRIARDLHDQTLADLRHLLMMTDQLPANGHDAGAPAPPATPAVFRSEIEAISNEIRRICEDLSPSVLENVGFSAALEWALSNAVAHSPTERKFEYEFVADEGLDERVNFSRATEMQIYRIVQEALSNLARHSSATHAHLSVSTSQAGEFTLTLEDDGRDFDPQRRRIKQGRGLANIRARASLIEAEVNWKRRKGGGTQFTLRKENAVRISPAQNED